ncbi:MAG: preprotein translocase subunit SecG [Patescibacteria group bacterium]
MDRIIQISTIIVSILLVTSILLQSRGAGLGGIFGGEGNIYRTKRGAEKVIFVSTIVLAIIFFGLALTRLFLI